MRLLYTWAEQMSLIRNDVKNKMAAVVGGTLMFSSVGTYGENFLISCNSAEKEHMTV